MARKRGGLAGFYDRNKGFLKKAVPVGLSFIPGVGIPLAAAAGAAMGADTEGKGYFSGFNVGGAVKGGLEGYGLGKGAQSIAGGVRNLLAPSGSNPSVLAKQIGMTPSATTGPAPVANVASGVADAARNVPSLMGTGGPVTSTDYIGRSVNQFLAQGGSTAPSASGAFGRAAADRAFGDLGMSLGDVANAGKNAGGGKIQGLLSGFRKNKDLIEMAGKGVQRFLPDPALDIKQQEMDLAQAKFDEEKRLTQMEQERRQRIAQLLMPYLQQNYGQYFGGQ